MVVQIKGVAHQGLVKVITGITAGTKEVAIIRMAIKIPTIAIMVKVIRAPTIHIHPLLGACLQHLLIHHWVL